MVGELGSWLLLLHMSVEVLDSLLPDSQFLELLGRGQVFGPLREEVVGWRLDLPGRSRLGGGKSWGRGRGGGDRGASEMRRSSPGRRGSDLGGAGARILLEDGRGWGKLRLHAHQIWRK